MIDRMGLRLEGNVVEAVVHRRGFRRLGSRLGLALLLAGIHRRAAGAAPMARAGPKTAQPHQDRVTTSRNLQLGFSTPGRSIPSLPKNVCENKTASPAV